MMLTCVGYFPSVSVNEADKVYSPETEEELLETNRLLDRKIKEFSGVTGARYFMEDDKLYIMAQTKHPALQMNEFLKYYINGCPDENLEPKISLLAKLRDDGGYYLGILVNARIPLLQYRIEPDVDPILGTSPYQSQEDKIAFAHVVPIMMSEAGAFPHSKLSQIWDLHKDGKIKEVYFMWHDQWTDDLSDERAKFEVEIFSPIKAELILNNNLSQTWHEALQETVTPQLEGYTNVQPFIITG